MASGAKTSNTIEIFSYIARDQKSGVVKGEIKALEERVVQEQLKKMGLDPISITIKKVSLFENLDINVFDSVPPDAIYNFLAPCFLTIWIIFFEVCPLTIESSTRRTFLFLNSISIGLSF